MRSAAPGEFSTNRNNLFAMEIYAIIYPNHPGELKYGEEV
jgi:hypothetical protein